MWRFGKKKKEQYVELERLDQKPSISSDKLPYEERPWYQNFSLQTWRPVVWAGVTTSTFVLIANLVVLFVGLSRPVDEPGTRILFRGDCKQASHSYTAWHLLINILSTFLLGASNAASQILAAPTRDEVDKAHAQGKWIHVGVLDFLNFKYITWKRIILCVLIALSSIPLHLLYNSAIFNTTTMYDYYAFSITPEFPKGGNFSVADAVLASSSNGNFPVSYYSSSYYSSSSSSSRMAPNAKVDNDVLDLQHQAMNGSLVRLTWQDCAREFGAATMAKYSAVLLVMGDNDNPNTTNSFWSSYVYYTPIEMQAVNPRVRPFSWICNGALNCDSQNITRAGSWNLSRTQTGMSDEASGESHRVDHCLARLEPQKCAVDISVQLMIAVLVCNVVKLCCFLFCLSIKNHRPFVTVGDAVCSFLAEPDPQSEGLGPISSRDARRGHFEIHRQAAALAKEQLPNQPLVYPGRAWEGRRHKYYAAVGLGRWLSTGFLSGIIFFSGLGLLIAGLGQPGYGVNAFNTNLGLNPNDVLTGDFTLFSAIFSANVLQLAVSNAYVLINSIFTCGQLAQELADFATASKTMRVTYPRGPQRSTYWLQLPYRWSVPLMVIMILLHWLISEALFMVDVQILGPDGEKIVSENSRSSHLSFFGLAWGPTATLCAVIEGGLLIIFTYAYGFRRYTAGMPVLSSCSIAISAACHPASREHDDAIFRPVRYGVLQTSTLGDAKPVGFSAMDVAPLQKGEIYGGATCIEDRDPSGPRLSLRTPPSSVKAPDSKQTAARNPENVGLLSSTEPPGSARPRPKWQRLFT